jgi:carbonic anhydrase
MTPLRRAVTRTAVVLGLLAALLPAACRGTAFDAGPAGDVLAAERDPASLRAALARGNAVFVVHPDRKVARERSALAETQSPPVAVLGCADSRAAPEWVFEQRPGRLFVVRDAGNVPDEQAVASVEYAVAHLGTRLVVVLGHDHCGAVSAALSGKDPGTPALRELVAAILPAVEAARARPHGDPLVAAIEENARRSARVLVERSDLLRDAVAAGRLQVLAAFLDLETGAVRFLE